MKQIETEILINVRPKKVWQVLSDFENHSKWNPFVKSVSGDNEVEETITLRIQPPDGKLMAFRPITMTFTEKNEFQWIGKIGVKGIFTGEHYFNLIDIGNNQTKLIHGERFNGFLARIMGKSLEKTKRVFELMNKALKNECEK